MKPTSKALFRWLKKAGERATAFSTPEEGQFAVQRMLISLEATGVWIRVLFQEGDGHGQTEFIVGWDELQTSPFDVIDLAIGKCLQGMEDALAARQAAEALEAAAHPPQPEETPPEPEAEPEPKAADDAGE